MYNKGKVLVTGSNGQLGQCLKEVVSSYDYEKNQDNYIFTTREEFDITDTKMMRKYLDENKDIKIIINCAAYTDVNGAETEEGYKKAMLINRDSVKNLAKLCKEYGIFLIHFGTDYMYDEWVSEKPITENAVNFRLNINFYEDLIDVNQKINNYGKSKLLGIHEVFKEMLPKNGNNVTEPNFVIIVVSWLYSEYGKNFVNTIIDRVRTDTKSEVVYTQVGSPTYAMDLAKYIIDVIENDDCCFISGSDNNTEHDSNYYYIINFANLGVASWYDIAMKIEDFYCLYTDIIIPREKPLNETFRPSNSVLNTSKIRKFKGDKSYVRHWLNALEECLMKRRTIMLRDKELLDLFEIDKLTEEQILGMAFDIGEYINKHKKEEEN